MKIYYVTGISGSGKSTVQKELANRGYTSFDSDDHGITTWVDRNTGQIVPSNEIPAGPDDKFLQRYQWQMSKYRIEQLASQSGDGLMFICGNASNSHELWSTFTKVFLLIIDEKTLIERIGSRTGNHYGKNPKDLEDILKWHKPSEAGSLRMGAVPIDATEPVQSISDKILSYIE